MTLPPATQKQALNAMAFLTRHVFGISEFQRERLQEHLRKARENHRQDLILGAGEVHLPEALQRKWPNASREWAWQYVFAAATLCPHPRTTHVARHHLHEVSMQRQFKEAVRKAQLSHPPHSAALVRHPPP